MTTVKEEIQLDMLDEGMSVNNTIKIKEKKSPCKTKLRLVESTNLIKGLEAELLAIKVFMAEVGCYEAWSDQKQNYIETK